MTASKALSNARWLGIARIGRLAIQFLSVAVLSRLLQPTDFGLLAMAVIVTNFADLLRDMGTSAALIQRERLSDALIDTVFWTNLGFGFVLALLVAAGAPLAAVVFHEPRLLGVLASLAIVFPLSSSGAAHLALMERKGSFRSIAAMELIAAVGAVSVALLAAWQGLGVYSLVLQTLAGTLIATVLVWILSPLRPRWRWHPQEFREIWGFSGNLVGFNVINYLARNADSVLIGRFLGPLDLGWYNMAYRLLMFPLINLTYVLNRAVLPIYSRQQQDLPRLRQNYLRTLSLIASVTAPLMAGLWALREPFIAIFLGQRWLAVANILIWFAPLGFFQSLLSTTGTIFTACGRTDLLRNVGLFNTAVVLAAFVIGLKSGLTVLTLFIVMRLLGSDIMAVIKSIWRQTACGLAMGALVAIADHSLAAGASDAARLALLVPSGALLYGALLYLLCRDLTADVREAVGLSGKNRANC